MTASPALGKTKEANGTEETKETKTGHKTQTKKRGAGGDPQRPAPGEAEAATTAAALVVVVVPVATVATAVAASAEAVEQPARDPRAGVRDAAEDARERVLRPAPGLTVGVGRIARLVGHRRVPVGVAARVVAGQDRLVRPVGLPPVELGEPDDGLPVGA